MSPTRNARSTFFAIIILLPFISYIQVSHHASSTASAFRLPAAPGLDVFIYQGNNDTHHDHVGKAAWAYDFTVGTTNFVVTAAQGGTIIGTSDSSTTGCDDVGCYKSKSTFI